MNPSKRRDPHDGNREGRNYYDFTADDIALGISSATEWIATGNSAAAIRRCPCSQLRAIGCWLLAKQRGGRP